MIAPARTQKRSDWPHQTRGRALTKIDVDFRAVFFRFGLLTESGRSGRPPFLRVHKRPNRPRAAAGHLQACVAELVRMAVFPIWALCAGNRAFHSSRARRSRRPGSGRNDLARAWWAPRRRGHPRWRAGNRQRGVANPAPREAARPRLPRAERCLCAAGKRRVLVARWSARMMGRDKIRAARLRGDQE